MIENLCNSGTQADFGKLVGISQPAVSGLISRGILSPGSTLQEWLHGYCDHLREMAAGRASGGGGLDLVQERARQAKEQADRIAMQNAVTRKEHAPVWLLEMTLASVSRQIVGILESIPVNLKRNSDSITTKDLEFITREIQTARNLAATVEFDWSELDGQERDPEGHPAGPDPDEGA